MRELYKCVFVLWICGFVPFCDTKKVRLMTYKTNPDLGFVLSWIEARLFKYQFGGFNSRQKHQNFIFFVSLHTDSSTINNLFISRRESLAKNLRLDLDRFKLYILKLFWRSQFLESVKLRPPASSLICCFSFKQSLINKSFAQISCSQCKIVFLKILPLTSNNFSPF